MNKTEFLDKFDNLKHVMLKLANEGLAGDDSAEMMNVSASQAKELHYSLLTTGMIGPSIPLVFNSARVIKVTETGVTIPLSRFKRYGLSDVFGVGTNIRCRAGEGCLIIEPAPNTSNIDDIVPQETEATSNGQTGIALSEAGTTGREEGV